MNIFRFVLCATGFSTFILCACSGKQVVTATADNDDEIVDESEIDPKVVPPTPDQTAKAEAAKTNKKQAATAQVAMADASAAAEGEVPTYMVGAVGAKKGAKPAEENKDEAPAVATVPKRVTAYLAKLGVELSPPPGFKPIKVRSNPDMHYEFAIGTVGVVEARYAADEMPGNVPAEAVALMVSFNTADGEDAMLDDQMIPADEVKRDYGGQWGEIIVYRPRATFAKGYAKCALQIIKKESRYMYTFVLFNQGGEDFVASGRKMMAAMQFKQAPAPQP